MHAKETGMDHRKQSQYLVSLVNMVHFPLFLFRSRKNLPRTFTGGRGKCRLKRKKLELPRPSVFFTIIVQTQMTKTSKLGQLPFTAAPIIVEVVSR